MDMSKGQVARTGTDCVTFMETPVLTGQAVRKLERRRDLPLFSAGTSGHKISDWVF